MVVVGLVVVTTLGHARCSPSTTTPGSTSDVARQARRRAKDADVTDVPGVVFVQLDGVAHAVLRRALRSGDVPDLHRWLRDGSHRLVGWETGWSSQTGVSQCGILHGSTVDMPAFRWVDKATGEVVVSNHPKCAAAIERAHSDGNGLLAHHGSSYGNLFSGDAERAVLTMSGAGRRKEGRTGAGYFGYFSRPGQATRTLLACVVEIGRERRGGAAGSGGAASSRASSGAGSYALLRTFTTVVTPRRVGAGRHQRHVRGAGRDLRRPARLRRGRPPLRARTGRRPGRAARPRPPARPHRAHVARGRRGPYKIVVLSDHGQTQGATFEQRTGQTLAELVGRAVRRGGVRRRRRRGGQHRVDGLAAPGPPRRRLGRRPVGADVPDRARLGQPRADLDPRRAAPARPARRSTPATRR